MNIMYFYFQIHILRILKRERDDYIFILMNSMRHKEKKNQKSQMPDDDLAENEI